LHDSYTKKFKHTSIMTQPLKSSMTIPEPCCQRKYSLPFAGIFQQALQGGSQWNDGCETVFKRHDAVIEASLGRRDDQVDFLAGFKFGRLRSRLLYNRLREIIFITNMSYQTQF